MKFHFEMDGDKLLQVQIERTIVRVRREAKKFIKEEAEAVYQESLSEVPVDTGALQASAFIESEADGSYTVGYGQSNVHINSKTHQATDAYALAVHERLDVFHPQGKAKFLEDPVNRHRHTMETKAAARLRRYVGGK